MVQIAFQPIRISEKQAKCKGMRKNVFASHEEPWKPQLHIGLFANESTGGTNTAIMT